MKDIEVMRLGCPYWGIAISCNISEGLSGSELEVPNDRIMGLIIYDKRGAAAQIAISVYMPFFQRKNCERQKNT